MAFISDITLGQYFPGHSIVHRLDPRTKLISALLLMSALLITSRIPVILGFVLILFLVTVKTEIPFSMVFNNLKPFIWLFGLTLLVHLLWTPGTIVFTLPGKFLSVTREGFVLGMQYTIRLAVLIVLAALLTLTTLPIELADALDRLIKPFKRIGLPVYEIVMMLTLSLRFIPTLMEETQRIKNAQLSRGASFEGNLVDRAKNIVPLIVPLFVSAFRRADDLALAMDSRCYHGGEQRSSYNVLKFGARDHVVIVASVLVLIFCIYMA